MLTRKKNLSISRLGLLSLSPVPTPLCFYEAMNRRGTRWCKGLLGWDVLVRATLDLQDSGLWPRTSKGLSLRVRPFSHCHCLICVKLCWCILNSTLQISSLHVSTDPDWCKCWCARIQGAFPQQQQLGCLRLYWKGDEGEFCFILCLKTQAWNIHHNKKNQALPCKKKKKKSLGSGQVFGYLF